jgi:hypothetical protein
VRRAVEPNDVEALAAGCCGGARLPRAAARARVARCSQDRMIEQYENLYREAAA